MTYEDCVRLFDVVVRGGVEELRLDDHLYISVADFLERFAGAECTYESLKQHPNSTPGWSAIWERLHKDGKL